MPVADDGSVSFTVPADRFVYFQLLDAEGRMLQSMRSGTIVRPGEISSCTGCHEDRRTSAVGYQVPESRARQPSAAATVVWPATPLQLHGRGPAGVRQALHVVS